MFGWYGFLLAACWLLWLLWLLKIQRIDEFDKEDAAANSKDRRIDAGVVRPRDLFSAP
jgi:hypothetical protein